MPYPHPLKIDGLIGKVEDTYLTDPTPTVADNGIRGVGRFWSLVGPEYAFQNDREDVMTGSLVEAIPAVSRGQIANFDWTVEAKGAGAAYDDSPQVVPEIHPLLVSAGLAPTIDASSGTEKVTYALADTGHGSATFWVYAGGKRIKISGCRSNLVWAIAAGNLARMRFQVQGIVTDIAEVAQASITYDSVESPALIGLGLALVPSGGSSWTPRFAEAELDLGNEIVRLDDANTATTGIEQFAIADRRPRLRLMARTTDLTTYPAYALRAARTLHTIDATVGSTQYNRIKIDVNDARPMGRVGHGEDNGFARWELEYLLRDLALIFD